MANSIGLASNFIPVIDEVYAKMTTSAVLEKPDFVKYLAGANAVQILSIVMQGLGDYDRNTGYADGAITATWETHTLTQDRGRKFNLDAMDDEETLGLTLGASMKEFMKTGVAKEIDAFRYATLASKAGLKIASGATLTASTASGCVDDGIAVMKEAEVSLEGGFLFVTPTVKKFISQSSAYVKNLNGSVEQGRTANFATYEGLAVIEVPQTRFYTAIELNDGTTTGETAGGFKKSTVSGSVGTDINFLIVAPDACLPVVKHNPSNIIAPDANQSADGYLMKYRLYHDLFVPTNKTKGIYLHNKAS